MIKKHLASDATLADVLPGLEDGPAYLGHVLATMRMCQKHYGDAWVRIGVTGKAGTPSYRIDRPDPASDSAAGTAVFGAYGGKSHDRFTPINTAETRWSSRALGMDAMLKLRDALRRPRDED
ncbi:hypothetical protein [uncultured Methylobacterium sp.]|uniref:hypothetical protein n=1 Tax=uncultured Methylobacterium sp. TaxID=157278 RepID=UPI0035CA1583